MATIHKGTCSSIQNLHNVGSCSSAQDHNMDTLFEISVSAKSASIPPLSYGILEDLGRVDVCTFGSLALSELLTSFDSPPKSKALLLPSQTSGCLSDASICPQAAAVCPPCIPKVAMATFQPKPKISLK